MRVVVYLLRQQGQRMTREAIAASKPWLGYIQVIREPGGRLGQWQRGALLKASPEAFDVLLQLHEVQITSWDRRGVVLAGKEIHYQRRERERDVFRQSWYVIPSSDGEPARPTTPAPTNTAVA